MLSHVGVLAATDDARMAGSAGEAAAITYVGEQLAQTGMGVSSTSFPITTFTSNGAGLAVSATDRGQEQTAIEVRAFLYSASTGGAAVAGPLVFASLGRRTDFADLDVRNKVVLIERGEIYFSEKTVNAAAAGASAIAIFNTEDEIIVGTLMSPVPVPVVALAAPAGRELVARLRAGEEIEASIWTDTTTESGTSHNVTGTLGDQPDPFVVVGAHIDSVDTPGANDNASGVAVILEVARMLAAEDGLPLGVRFVAFGAEEIGLHGSTDWVRRMSRAERTRCVAMINIDSVGSGFRVVGYVSSADPASALLEAASAAGSSISAVAGGAFAGETLVMDSSDHASFARAGIPAMMVSGDPMLNIHTDGDTVDRVDVKTMASAASVVAATVWRLATMDLR
jgi:aminopeptidase YwaD